MSEWISVYKRRPSDGELVMSRVGGDEGCYCGRCEFDAATSTFRTYEDYSNRFIVTIWKHDEWKPLPEPPK